MYRKRLKKGIASFSIVGVLLVTGCTTYQAKPLPKKPLLAPSISELETESNRANPNPDTNVILGHKLTLKEVAVLAVKGNPDLKSKRKSMGIAEAQTYAAGLFTDPQFNVNLDRPTSSLPGLSNAWGTGLSYDITSLITHSNTQDAAKKHQKKVYLNLIWAEWQVILQARILAVQSLLEQKRQTLLSKVYSGALARYNLSTKNMAKGNVTLNVNSSDLTVLLGVSNQLNNLLKKHNNTLSKLDYLLGLQPDTSIPLADLPNLKLISKRVMNQKLKHIARTRPDLIALQIGYQEQEARLRGAILRQFPAFNIGVAQARDTAQLHTSGLNIGLTLPLFSGNKGNIAIERATRDQLRQEYEVRLEKTFSDIKRLINLQSITRLQQSTLARYMPTLNRLFRKTQKAYQNRDVAALIFLNIESTWIKGRMEQIDLLQTQWETQIDLEALLGGINGNFVSDKLIKTRRVVK